jgi:hypothetical protein
MPEITLAIASYTTSQDTITGDYGLGFADDTRAGQRGVGSGREAFLGDGLLRTCFGIIGDVQGPEVPAVGELAVHQIRRPAAVRPLRRGAWRARDRNPGGAFQ